MGKGYSSTIKNEESYAEKIKKKLHKKKQSKQVEVPKIVLNEPAEVQEQKYLLSMMPLQPSFLGTTIEYPEIKKAKLKKALTLELNKFRAGVLNLADKKGVSTSRIELQEAMKKFPNFYELHAINSIQKFCDILQSGSDKNKLDLLKSSLTEMGIAIYNGGYSIFNTTWFIKIYFAYLNLLNDRINRAQLDSQRNHDQNIKQLKEDLEKARIKSQTLITVIPSLKALKKMNLTMKGTAYIVESINNNEIKEAAMAIMNNLPAKKVGKRNLRASYVNHIIGNLLRVFSDVPIFFDLMGNVLGVIPDVHRDLVLQKRMIITSQGITEFELAFSSGDLGRAIIFSEKIYQFCLSTIVIHMQNALITKNIEIDPYLKLGWIIRKAQDFLSREIIKDWIREADSFLKILGTRRMKYEQGIAASIEILYDFNRLKVEYSL